MADYSVKTDITGRGNLAEFAKRCSDALKGMLTPIRQVNSALDKPEATKLGKVGNVADQVAGKFRSGLGSITAWLPALGAIGAAGSLAGLVGMTRHAAENMEGIGLASLKLGYAPGALAAIRYGFKLTNVEVESGEKALSKLNKTLYDAATGKNKDAAALFARLGINLRDANGHVRKAADVLPQLMAGFEKNEDASLRAAMAQALFGKAGQDMIPFLVKGKDWLAQLGDEQKRFSNLTAEQREGLGHLEHSYKELDKAGAGLSTRLSAALAPGLTRVANATTGWIVRNREVLGQAVDRKVGAIVRVVEGLTGAVTALLAVPFIAHLTEGANAGTLADIALAALGVTMAGPVLAAIEVVTKAWWVMTRATLLNPVGLVLAAIAFAAYAIYSNWGAITSWFSEQMAAIREAFDRGFGRGLLEIWTRFNPITLISTAINGLSKWLFGIDLFEAGRNLIRRLIEGIKALLPDFQTVWGPIERGMNWAGRGVTAAAGVVSDQAAIEAGLAPTFSGPQITGPAPQLAAASPPSEAKITVDFTNLPQGARTTTETAGPAKVNTNVGYSMQPGGAY